MINEDKVTKKKCATDIFMHSFYEQTKNILTSQVLSTIWLSNGT